MAKKKKKKQRSQDASTEVVVPLGTKLQYVGIGAILGVVAAPTVRKLIEQARPEFDKLIERLTAHAEELAENASDFMANARATVTAQELREERTGHTRGDHEHSDHEG